MSLREYIVQARSYRRFDEARDVDPAVLERCVDALRFVPSGANDQPLRYAISTSREVNAAIFPHLVWARRLPDWDGPAAGERPSAYVIIGGDKRWPANHMVDKGIAAQTLLLLLAEAGMCGCMIGGLNGPAVGRIVDFNEGINVLLVMAVGYPGEKVVVDDLAPDGDTAYYRDADDAHHVPKRGLAEVLLKRFT